MFYKTVVEDAVILHNQDSLDDTIAGSFQEITTLQLFTELGMMNIYGHHFMSQFLSSMS